MLVVDDSEQARQILSGLLSSMSFVVATASSGEDAVALAHAADAAGRPFDIAFLDWKMPGMDGFETHRQLARLPHPPQSVVVTSHGREDVFKELTRAGIDLMLTKPVNPSQLFDTAMRALGGSPTAGETPRAHHSGATLDMSAVRGARVLLVDDNDLNQQVGAELLSGAGLVVDVAENGQVALDMLSQASYDIVLMDMQMPVMDGLTATRNLRENPAWARLPVLAMTANAMSSDRDQCLEAGMNGHLAKPIDPHELFASLLQWIAPRETQTADGQLDRRPTASAGTASLSQALRDIPGLNAASGLKRVLGKHSAYEGMLRKFVAGQAAAVQNTRAALSAGQRDDALRAMHTLKGTAATIGATPLADLAQAAEHAIGQGATPDALEALLQPVDGACQILVTALQRALSPEDDGATTGSAIAPLDAEAGRELLARLESLLADDDSDAIELFRDSSVSLKALVGDAHAEMKRALDGYDFVQALAVLRAVQSIPAPT